MATLNKVVAELASASGDLNLMARFLTVDANEVAAALSDAEPDSAEAVALRLLAKYNPATSVADSVEGDAP